MEVEVNSNTDKLKLLKQLIELASTDNVAKLPQLIEAGMDVNEQFQNDLRPLHVAAQFNAVNLMEELIETGAIVEAPVNRFQPNSTPLFDAVSSGSTGAVKLLLENGANPFAGIEPESETLLELAKRQNMHAIAEILREAMAEKASAIFSFPDHQGMSPG